MPCHVLQHNMHFKKEDVPDFTLTSGKTLGRVSLGNLSNGDGYNGTLT